jgi:hypothetical protein
MFVRTRLNTTCTSCSDRDCMRSIRPYASSRSTLSMWFLRRRADCQVSPSSLSYSHSFCSAWYFEHAGLLVLRQVACDDRGRSGVQEAYRVPSHKRKSALLAASTTRSWRFLLWTCSFDKMCRHNLSARALACGEKHFVFSGCLLLWLSARNRCSF